MSDRSNNQGRAYEFAWLYALHNELSKVRAVSIDMNSSYDAIKRAWNLVSGDEQSTYAVSAAAAVKTIIELEPIMEECPDDVVLLVPQIDKKGEEGDVRDIVIVRSSRDWEIGLSIKHNHEAIKHSRLSHKLDFGKEWFGEPCSDQYWADIKPVFDMLKAEKKNGKHFSDLSNKERDVYIPLLNAFVNEVNRKYASNRGIARKMIEYLIGVTDYYKVISHDSKKMTMIRTFNVHGTLNQPSRVKVSAITVPILTLPTRLVALQRKPDSDTTVEMYLDNGWQLSFRIHNAEDKIIPSLKFDIQFVGIPPEVLNIECYWYK